MPRQKGVVEKQKAETATRDANGIRKLAYKRYKEGVDYIPIEDDNMVTVLEAEKRNIEQMIKRGGRPPKYASVEELQQQIKGYWDYLAEANREQVRLIPDIEGLASYLGVSRDTLNEWERADYQGFSDTLKVVKNSIAAVKKQLALCGGIPPIIAAMDFNNNHGYVNTSKQDITLTPGGGPLGAEQSPDAIQGKYKELPED